MQIAFETSKRLSRATVRRKMLEFDITAVFWAACILPFLEPWSTGLLAERGFYPQLISAFSFLALCARVTISAYSILRVISPRYLNNKLLLGFALFSVGICISSSFQGVDVFLSALSQAFQLFGFACLLFLCFVLNKKTLYNSMCISFGLISLLAIGSVLLFENGITNDSVASSRLYSFGGKNHIFVTLLPAIVLLAFRRDSSKPTWVPSALAFLFALLAHLIDSSSSTICFVMLGLSLLPLKGRYLIGTINPFVAVGMVVVVFCGTVLSSFITNMFAFLFDLIGRESTFSSRDAIWDTAMSLFLSSPLFGNGPGITYSVEFLSGSMDTSNAHCFYLGIASQYGIVGLLPLLAMFGIFVKEAVVSYSNAEVMAAFSGVLLMLFHSIFDDLPLYYMVLICFLLFYAYDPLKDRKARLS